MSANGIKAISNCPLLQTTWFSRIRGAVRRRRPLTRQAFVAFGGVEPANGGLACLSSHERESLELRRSTSHYTRVQGHSQAL